MHLNTGLKLEDVPSGDSRTSATKESVATMRKKVKELAEIDKIFTNIEKKYAYSSDEVKGFVSQLIDVAKSRLANCKGNEENLIIACNIIFKLINRDIFENELILLGKKLKNEEMLEKAAYHIQGNINKSVEVTLENILDQKIKTIILKLEEGKKSPGSNFNEFSLFCTYAEIINTENKLNMVFIKGIRSETIKIRSQYEAMKPSELLLPVTLIGNAQEINIKDFLELGIKKIEDIFQNRNSISKWGKDIKTLLNLFANPEKLRERIKVAIIAKNTNLIKIFESIISLELFESDKKFTD